MSSSFDIMQKWVQPAGPKEGRDPVRVSRAFVATRNRIFTVLPADLGLVPTERLPRVWAVLVDLSSGAGAASVVCSADGSTSLYSVDGGGIVGVGNLPAVMDAAVRLLETAERVLDRLPAKPSIGVPAPGSVAFVVLTYDGMRRIEVAESEALDSSGGAAQELYAATRDVVTELGIAEGAAEG